MELNAAQKAMLEARVRVPDDVVYRKFAEETIVLNLENGKYHGLNRVGAEMVTAAAEGVPLLEVAEATAEQYGRPVEEVQADLADLCLDLSERGLIEVQEERED